MKKEFRSGLSGRMLTMMLIWVEMRFTCHRATKASPTVIDSSIHLVRRLRFIGLLLLGDFLLAVWIVRSRLYSTLMVFAGCILAMKEAGSNRAVRHTAMVPTLMRMKYHGLMSTGTYDM